MVLLSTNTLNNIENELIIGLAGGLGVDFDEVAESLGDALHRAGFHVVTVKIAQNFPARNNDSEFAACYWKMQYGTKQRKIHGNDFWARKAVEKIFFSRPELSHKYKKIAYLIRSLKTKEELELLSNVYGRNFISVATFSETDSSFKYLEKKLRLNHIDLAQAQQEMQKINTELQLGADLDLEHSEELFLDDVVHDEKVSDSDVLAKFLMRKDQEETHMELKKYGQNLFKCYSIP